jgi:hypothetical protein
MATRMKWKEMMNAKTMIAMYTRKHQTTWTSSFDILLDWIAISSVDKSISILLLMK